MVDLVVARRMFSRYHIVLQMEVREVQMVEMEAAERPAKEVHLLKPALTLMVAKAKELQQENLGMQEQIYILEEEVDAQSLEKMQQLLEAREEAERLY